VIKFDDGSPLKVEYVDEGLDTIENTTADDNAPWATNIDAPAAVITFPPFHPITEDVDEESDTTILAFWSRFEKSLLRVDV